MLSKEKIEKRLSGVKVSVFDTIDSTNSEAKRSSVPFPHLICADSQSAGRGRLGRSFYSPEKTGLYMSLAFEPRAHMADAVTVTAAAAVAVCAAIDRLCGTDCKIKWVNDVYLSGKKVCGILTEATTKGDKTVIIVGIGINCTTEAFPEDIRDRAGSIGCLDREALAAAVVNKLIYYCNNLEKRDWLPEYRRRSLVLGEKINYTESGITKEATAVDIDENGGLVVKENGVIKTLSTGEITVRIR